MLFFAYAALIAVPFVTASPVMDARSNALALRASNTTSNPVSLASLGLVNQPFVNNCFGSSCCSHSLFTWCPAWRHRPTTGEMKAAYMKFVDHQWYDKLDAYVFANSMAKFYCEGTDSDDKPRGYYGIDVKKEFAKIFSPPIGEEGCEICGTRYFSNEPGFSGFCTVTLNYCYNCVEVHKEAEPTRLMQNELANVTDEATAMQILAKYNTTIDELNMLQGDTTINLAWNPDLISGSNSSTLMPNATVSQQASTSPSAALIYMNSSNVATS